MTRLWTIGLALLCVLLTSAAQLALKSGVASTSMQSVLASGTASTFLTRAIFSPLVLVGLGLYVGSTVIWLLVLAKLDVSYAYPFVSLGFVFTALYAHYALDEPMAALRVAGIALIVTGVCFVAKS